MEASSVKRSSNSPPNKCVEHNIGVDGVSERHSGIDHRTKSEKTNGRGERFHDRELPLPTQFLNYICFLPGACTPDRGDGPVYFLGVSR